MKLLSVAIVWLLFTIWIAVFTYFIFDQIEKINVRQFNRERAAVIDDRKERGIAMAVLLNTYRGLDVHPDYAWAAETGFFDYDIEFNAKSIYFYGVKQ